MNRKHLLFLLVIPFLIILAACGDATMHLKKDGSGKMEIELPNNDYYNADDIKSELEAGIAGEEGVSKLSVKEKKDKIIASFQFASMEDFDTYAYMIPVADYVITESGRLDELVFVEDEMEFKENSKEIFVKLPSDMDDFDTAKVILPGKVVAHSENLNAIEKDTVEMSSYGDSYVVYSTSMLSSFLIWGIVLFVLFVFFALIAGLIIFLVIKKKKSQENSKNEVVNDGNDLEKDEASTENDFSIDEASKNEHVTEKVEEDVTEEVKEAENTTGEERKEEGETNA